MHLSKKNMNCFVIFLCSLLLSACEADKEPLKGKREYLITLPNDLLPDHTLKNMTIAKPKAVNAREWLSGAYTPSNHMPAFTLNGLNIRFKERVLSSIKNPKEMFTPPLFYKGHLYLMDDRGNVYVVDPTKTEVVKTLFAQDDDDSTCGGGMTIYDGLIYITTSLGDVVGIDLKTQKQLFKKSLKVPIRCAPTVSQTALYYITVNNEVVALDSKTGEPLWSYSGIYEPSFVFGTASPVLFDGILVTALSSGEVLAFDAMTGTGRWNAVLTPGQRSETLSSVAHVKAPPVVYDGMLYALSFGGRLGAFTLNDGDIKFEKNITGSIAPIIHDGFMIVFTHDGQLCCMSNRDGAVKWIYGFDSSQKATGLFLTDKGVLVIGSKGRVTLHDLQDGRLLKKLELEDEITVPSILVNGEMFILSDRGNLFCIGA